MYIKVVTRIDNATDSSISPTNNPFQPTSATCSPTLHMYAHTHTHTHARTQTQSHEHLNKRRNELNSEELYTRARISEPVQFRSAYYQTRVTSYLISSCSDHRYSGIQIPRVFTYRIYVTPNFVSQS